MSLRGNKFNSHLPVGEMESQCTGSKESLQSGWLVEMNSHLPVEEVTPLLRASQ